MKPAAWWSRTAVMGSSAHCRAEPPIRSVVRLRRVAVTAVTLVAGLIAVRALAGGLVSGTLRLPQGLNPLLAAEQPGGLGLLDRPASGHAQRDAGHHGLVGSLNQD